MANQEGSNFTAGGGKKLGIIRHSRELMSQMERLAGNDIYPGEALMAETNGGTREFVHHDGSVEKTVYVAVEARGRGMDAQTTDPYTANKDYVIAVNASAGAGLHLLLKDGENVTDSTSLVPDPSQTGKFIQYNSSNHSGEDVYGETDEALDLTGSPSEAGLVKVEVGN